MEFTFTTDDRTAEVLNLLLSSAKLKFSIEHIMELAVSAHEIKLSITWLGLAVIIGGVIIAYIAFYTSIFQYIFTYIFSSIGAFSLVDFLAKFNTITTGVAVATTNVTAIAVGVNQIRTLLT